MLENVQIINDNSEAKLSDTSKLEDYLDYLHVKQVKKQTQKMFSLEEVKRELTQE